MELHNKMIDQKLKSQDQLFKLLPKLRAKGQKIVFARGCFDVLHPGHLYYLEQAKSQGNILVVWLNRDLSIQRLKGKGRPLFPESHRARVISALGYVDYVVFFGHEQGLQIIKRFQPEVVALPKVTPLYRRTIESYGGRVQIIPLLSEHSTTKIIDLIVKKYGSLQKKCPCHRR